VLGLVLAAGAAPALWWQIRLDGDTDGWNAVRATGLAGLLLAGAYVCALAGPAEDTAPTGAAGVFAPLGRMALTNYLSATVLVLAAGHILGRPGLRPSTRVLQIACTILIAQWLFSTLWLRR
jgi:uncharacterized protein